MNRLLSKLFLRKTKAGNPEAPAKVENVHNETTSIGEEEFFLPVLGLDLAPYLVKDDLQGVHHLARYYWAERVLQAYKPSTVLDIACGAGYGSFILAKSFPACRIIGADYDERAINVAIKTYTLNNLSYVKGDMVKWEKNCSGQNESLGIYPVILSFDTIEHLDHPEIALLRVVEHLEEKGVFMLSTPISFPSTNLKPGWQAHKIEYGQGDLLNLLKRFFKDVLVPEEGTLPCMDFWTETVNKDKERYLNLANPIVCKNPIRV